MRQSADMKKTVALERRMRRSAAAALLSVTPPTLRRWERAGILRGIKLNSRITLYLESDILKLANGEVRTVTSG